jgi:hypothetical protein
MNSNLSDALPELKTRTCLKADSYSFSALHPRFSKGDIFQLATKVAFLGESLKNPTEIVATKSGDKAGS